MKLTENFFLEEFNCRDGTPVPDVLMTNVKQLAINLQELRDAVNAPVYVNSGYRTTEYNKRIGGAKSSQHLLAKAADITTKSYTPKQLAALIEKLIAEKKMKQGGIGIYKGFVHYDIRGKKTRW